MKVLRFNQYLLVFSGMSSPNLHNKINEFPRCSKTYIIAIGAMMLTVLCGNTIWQSLDFRADFLLKLDTFFPFLCGIQCMAIFLTIGYEMNTVKSFQIQLQRVADIGK